jgi:hemolysin III
LQPSPPLSQSLSTPSKPVWRGVLHGWAFYLAIPAGVTVSLFADNQTARIAAAIFSGTVVVMFGASALYHRFTWSPGVRSWLRRLDHLGIFGLIAGTYTAYGLLVLDDNSRIVILAVVWSGAAAVVILKFAWVAAPKWISVVTGVLLGWVAVAVFPQLIHRGGLTPSMLTLGAGVLYTLGAIVYARRKPDPIPAVFGYHELFHALVVAAVGLQYAAVGSLVLR